MRHIVDAIRCLTHNGTVWRALPADFPPAGTVYWRAGKWQADGSTERMHDDLRERVRLAAGRRCPQTGELHRERDGANRRVTTGSGGNAVRFSQKSDLIVIEARCLGV
jgi:transposase